MNPFLLKYSKDLEGYDSLRTQSSKESTSSKQQESFNPNSLTRLNDTSSKDSKITEFNSELSENSCIETAKEEKISDFGALIPLNDKEEKKKRCSKAFARFKKRYSAVAIEEEKKVKESDKIKNIVAMLEKKIKGECDEENNKGFLERRNAIIINQIPMMRRTIGKNQKKKGEKLNVVDIK